MTSPGLSQLVLPVTAAVLAALFALQRWGTGRVGNLFGPVMTLWFLAIGVVGLAGVVSHPGILRTLSPTYAVLFVVEHPYTAFIAMGAVVLAITGAVTRTAASQSEFFRLPLDRTILLSTELAI